jgi:hypothetical protein
MRPMPIYRTATGCGPLVASKLIRIGMGITIIGDFLNV